MGGRRRASGPDQADDCDNHWRQARPHDVKPPHSATNGPTHWFRRAGVIVKFDGHPRRRHSGRPLGHTNPQGWAIQSARLS
jgi:hypothetical protein